MTPRALALTAALLLSACGSAGEKGGRDADEILPRATGFGDGGRLEAAAIDAGLIPDPHGIALAGRYEHRGDIGVDRFCAISGPAKNKGKADGGGGNAARIGMMALFGPDSQCEAQGQARWDGKALRITLSGGAECAFSARFDGVTVQLPGRLPEGCADYCSPRASFSGVVFYLVETGNAAASETQGRSHPRLCPASPAE